MTPKLELTLQPDGSLAARAPDGALVPLHPDSALATLQRMLFDQALGTGYTPDGKLSLARQLCLREHAQWPSANCPHCRADGRFRTHRSERELTATVGGRPDSDARERAIHQYIRSRGAEHVVRYPEGKSGRQLSAQTKPAPTPQLRAQLDQL